MTHETPQPDALDTLLFALRDGELTQPQASELEQMVLSNAEAMQQYLRVVHLSVGLRWMADGGFDGRKMPIDEAPLQQSPFNHQASSESSPFPILLDNSAPGMVTFFSSGWPVAYLIATVIFGFALTIASFTYTAPSALLAHRRGAAPASAEPRRDCVANVTGMVDCEWVVGAGLWTPNRKIAESAVSVGDMLNLASGFAEITYNSGAKVILQGPVAYKVESASGGFLSRGRLTARVEKRNGRPAATDSGIADGRRSIDGGGAGLFSIKTPTATVNDLGTEFGVEVARDQTTQVHVIEGLVRVAVDDADGTSTKQVTLTAGKAVSLAPRAGGFRPLPCSPDSFVRTLPARADAPDDRPVEKAYIEAVLADKPLGYWPLNESPRKTIFHDRSGNGYDGTGMNRVGAEPGPLGAETSAVTFDGETYIDIGRHDEFALTNDFTVEAWVRVEPTKPWGCVISAADEGRQVGWGIGVTPPDSEDASDIVVAFTGWSVTDHVFKMPAAELPADRWVHLAVAYDRENSAHLLVNGRIRASSTGHTPARQGPIWLQIGCDIPGEHGWRGGLAHVAVYPRALTEDQIQNHFRQKEESDAVTEK